jgi:flagellar basal-body rod protein FlgF
MRKGTVMDTTSYLALSSQVALQRHMATVANNIANATTTGYRAEHTLFEQVLERAGSGSKIAFVQDVALVRDQRPGPIAPTGNAFDLAIDGSGYFAFATPDGPRYTRAGRLSVDTAGQLVNAQGHPLLDVAGNPIVLAEGDHDISVAKDGAVSGRNGPIAQIGIVGFENELALERTGDGFYRSAEAPTPSTEGKIVQGALEGSNVQPVLEMTSMLETVRAFEGAKRLLDTQHDLDRATIERTIRVSS